MTRSVLSASDCFYKASLGTSFHCESFRAIFPASIVYVMWHDDEREFIIGITRNNITHFDNFAGFCIHFMQQRWSHRRM